MEDLVSCRHDCGHGVWTNHTDSNSGKTRLQSHSVLLPRGSRHSLHTPVPHLWEKVVINNHCEDQRGEGWVKGTQIYTQASDTVQRNQNPPLERTHGCWYTRIYILHSLPTTILFQLSSGHHWNTGLCLQIQKSGIHREHMARHMRMWCLTLLHPNSTLVSPAGPRNHHWQRHLKTEAFRGNNSLHQLLLPRISCWGIFNHTVKPEFVFALNK